jgi:Zn-dependent metalloprotease
MSTCQFVPPYLLDRIAALPDSDLAAIAHRTRAVDEQIRRGRPSTPATVAAPRQDAWEMHDAGNRSLLPGPLVRTPGQPGTGDAAADEAALGVGETLSLLTDLGRRSYDDHGATVVATVHYEQDYDNAFWNGTQLVFGDGDGKVFGRFTKPIDVLGHELFHAVTQYTANLTYSGQSGALNESISDCFGSCVKQRHLGQEAASADWLIGEGIFLPGVQGVALRSMKAPGTAYDDPQLGKDPQVGSMSQYVETTDDNGGVHLNSGIPNRAFYLAATGIGGTSWEGAGRIWYAALTSGIAAGATFADFAQACVTAAGAHADTVREAWTTVVVLPGPSSPGVPPAGTVEITRSGGFAGIRRTATLDLGSDDPRVAEARDLVARLDVDQLAMAMPSAPQPDRFVYQFRVGDQAFSLAEHELTPELARLSSLLLS